LVVLALRLAGENCEADLAANGDEIARSTPERAGGISIRTQMLWKECRQRVIGACWIGSGSLPQRMRVDVRQASEILQNSPTIPFISSCRSPYFG
jgi:hypothetical protein